MTPWLRLALASAWNRRFTLGLTLCAIALSVAMLLGVERARIAAREGFSQSVAGTDLIVGARTSPVQLLLYAVFRLGDATHEMRWQSVQAIAANPLVAWSVPLSLGDSHRGFPVLGTTTGYFEHFRYGLSRPLALAQGRAFAGGIEQVFECVIGAEVAERLGYRLGDRVVLSHGSGDPERLAQHADKPFIVVGILARTGTPVDRTLHISLEAMQAIHLEWVAGVPMPGFTIPAEQVRKFDLAPKTVTAMLVGLKSRGAVFRMQRAVDDYAGEALLAVLPGVALDQLWRIVGVVENALLAVSALVVAIGLAGMVAVVWASLNERRRELAILRSVGAGPLHVFLLLGLEGLLLTAGGIVLGFAALTLATVPAAPWVQAQYGLALPLWTQGWREATLMGAILAAGLVAALLPAWRASRLALADGLTPRL